LTGCDRGELARGIVLRERLLKRDANALFTIEVLFNVLPIAC
jgi:hypothetical protein